MKKRVFLAIPLGILAFLLFIFISYQKTEKTPQQTTSLANPASENCIKQGGQLIIQKRGDGGEYGLCQFEDNQACEEWALFRNECPMGGIKTIGYDTPAQSYCAVTGGKVNMQSDTCTLPNRQVCNTNDVYNGTCPQ